MYNYFIYYKYSYKNNVRYTTLPELYKGEDHASVSLDERIRGMKDIKKIEDMLRKKLEEESRNPIIPSRIEVKELLVTNWKRFEDE